MRTALLIAFSFFVVPAFCQDTDSLTVAKEVDSSRAFTGKREFDKALEVSATAEKIALEKFGRESAGYAGCCNNRGRVLAIKGDHSQAEKWWLETRIIREKVFGKDHPQYANILSNLAILYGMIGNNKKAEPLYVEALTIREKALGKEHPDYSSNLNSLAILYHDMGNYEKAVPLYQEKIAIQGKTLGKEHPDYSSSLNNLAILYHEMRNNEKAKQLYLENIAIQGKTLGKEHPDYAGSLINLANLYSDMGEEGEAEQLLLVAKDIFEVRLNQRDHPYYMNCLNNLARLYSQKGNYKKAEPLYLEAKTILENTIGKEHPDYAMTLNNLSVLYMTIGQYEKAEPLCLESMAIRAKTYGKEHPEYAHSLLNTANLYKDLGNYKKAELLYLESQAILASIFSKEHPDYAMSLLGLANLYGERGNYEQAVPLFLEAKSIWEKVFGKEHREYALGLNNLAMAYEQQKKYFLSEPLLAESFALQQNQLLKSTMYLSERELANYTATFFKTGDRLCSYMMARSTGGNPKGILPALTYDHALFHKGFLLTAAARLNNRSTAPDESGEIRSRLEACRRRLAVEYAKPIADRKGVAELEEKANAVEKELARTVAGYAEAVRQVKWQEVQTSLKVQEAAIEFVYFGVHFPIITDSTLYAALLLRPGDSQPRFIPLFEEKSLDSLLQRNTDRNEGYVKRLYSLAERGATPLGKPQKTLYELLWKPLEKELDGVQTIYFSPSGLLHRLNLAAIPINLDSVLGDRYQLVELGSTRQLVVPATVKPAANDAVLFGGISYGSNSTAMSQANAALDSISIASRGELSFANTDSTLRVGTWSNLPFTEREVGNVEKTLKSAGFQPETRKGYAATEEIFKSIGAGGKPSPRVLHLATHGFFFPDPKSAVSSERVSGEQVSTFKLSDHPMIRSGLILAGGNHAWATGKPLREGMEDGILTAYEISQMNLSNTELAVLSACETGLGDISGNEGVFGLQRAFKIAGAKYLIMSLWQVPDQETSVFMTAFYRHWLEGKKSIPDAFRATQRDLRERFVNPYQWAGFVLVE